jgi:threonine synthase
VSGQGSQPVRFVCHGCGEAVDAAARPPFRCPRAGRPGDDVDHLLVPLEGQAPFPDGDEPDPFVRFRTLLSPYRLARGSGLSDAAWLDLVGQLDRALQETDGRGFRVTPLARQPGLGAEVRLGSAARKAPGAGPAGGVGPASLASAGGELWVKDETGNVSGSHKARHLMGVMLYLRVLEAARLPAAEGLRTRRLAIASCGNAALAAAVVARAARWPLEVFIPPDAGPAVVRQLGGLGAQRTVCRRRPGEVGDPCFLRFREAVAAGAIPFGVQGPENGLAVEGGRTLAFELAQAFRAAGAAPGTLYVQVGGGALASALAQGFALAASSGVLQRAPRLVAVQTAGCAPLERAWRTLGDGPLDEAARHRSRHMWPWEQTPHSAASGILDDETYDWWAVAQAMRATGGRPVVVDEEVVARAWQLGRQHTGIAVSATGTAGLAGLLAAPPPDGEPALVVFSGVDR